MTPNELTYRIARAYLEDTSHSLTSDQLAKVDGYLRSRDHGKLSSLCSLIGFGNMNPASCEVLRQFEAFFKKNTAFLEEEVASKAAAQSFYEAEKQCARSNLRLTAAMWDGGYDPHVRKLWLMERSIEELLGDFDDFLREIPKLVRVTGGATSSTPRKRSQPFTKLRKRLNSSVGSTTYLQALSNFFGYGLLKVNEVTTNRVEFVPKTWKTHRTIACEPMGSVPFQLAFDEYGKRRLRQKWGINLRDQSRNQRMAREGARFDHLATIDLASASDTVSQALVEWAFPAPFFQYLMAFRSRCGSMPDGTIVSYEKFSSMGNGSTFVIETILFAAACLACGIPKENLSVYGDDIVIPSGKATEVCELLAFLGFTVNEEKSFISGPFRESCGEEYFVDRRVTPFYIRQWRNQKAFRCHLVNGLLKLESYGLNMQALLIELIDEWNLPFVPYNSSTVSGVMLVPGHLLLSKTTRNHYGIQQFKGYLPSTQKVHTEDLRTYFLWFLLKYQGRKDVPKVFALYEREPLGFLSPLIPDSPVREEIDRALSELQGVETSWVSNFIGKYEKGWIRLDFTSIEQIEYGIVMMSNSLAIRSR